ncbi:hypothetical protein ACH5RR_009040 [Cinchona calisaya]|uniref:Uncharacterized protein n=1 Tax=Cinchona calisaya TaxID=153742 RepID=A0ABD3AEZ2_9GENT
MITGRRYKDLSRLYTKLVTRAAETVETYKINKCGLLKLLEEVDPRLQSKELTFECLGINVVEKLRESLKEKVCFKRPPPKDSAALESTSPSYNENVNSSIEDLSTGTPIDQNYLLSTQPSKDVDSSIDGLSKGPLINEHYFLSTQPSEYVYWSSNHQNQVGPHTLKDWEFSMSMTRLPQAQQAQGFGSLIINNSKQERINYRVSEIQGFCNENCGCPIPCI